mmetsp:Transcript_2584/g.6097  ORF Transcript_2584/g.6097 Transcript_2584/m.6097 type:complete len:232 (+) Transcript_2584:102-797(+)|eukprot:CAMPEP_0114564300 /NCGR_PEP_ID=MMETSP0114-20121206/13638_1 /TAXON_ID=31324 /ORGANISM="Goniomonas sp, Strain m" /LENGTH=231 /DNA_ID=CAMNT_0001750341 /DNA_START=1 /DNA_END=696 /DNA_ORIENTATION=-
MGNSSSQERNSQSRISWHSSEGPAELKCAVPVVLRWTEPGTDVFVVGSYSAWQNKVYLSPQPTGEFATTLHLAPGEYQYKFIVDGEWRCAATQTMTKDRAGNENNWMKVEEEQSPDVGQIPDITKPELPQSPRATYTSVMPDPDDYLKEPPLLPPHLQFALLNQPPVRNDPNLLPLPHQSSLHHLFRTEEPELHGLRVLGTTKRHKTKFVTTVYYCPADMARVIEPPAPLS